MEKQFQIYSVDTQVFYTKEEEKYNKLIIESNNTKRIIGEYLFFELSKQKEVDILEKVDMTKLKGRRKAKYKNDVRNLVIVSKHTGENYTLSDYIHDIERLKKLKQIDSNKELNLIDEEIVELNELRNYQKIVLSLNKKNKKALKSKMFAKILKDNKLYQEQNNINKENAKYLKSEILKNKELVRTLKPTAIHNEETGYKRNPISLFGSSISRTLEIEMDAINTDLFIVTVLHYPLMEQLIKNNFTYLGEEFIQFSSSAGQIREKKVVFLKKSVYDQYVKKIMCGISIEDINNSEQKGMNINKFMAYLSLCFSATDKIESFDIKKAIVIKDFETEVKGTVDVIDNKTFNITRKLDYPVKIPHSDGCGWVLSSISKENFMIRLPWVKGLMASCDYISFCRLFNKDSYKIMDIDNKERDLKAEGIEYVFTESQWKMKKYYSSWEDYQNKFIENECHAAECKREAKTFKKATFNYQMLQTLLDMTDAEINVLTKPTEDFLANAYTDITVMLEILGAVKSNNKKTSLQKCLEVYPELLHDYHTQEKLSSAISSRKKRAMYGKIKINGTYTFLVPDLFAWMHFSICKNKNPIGLLGKNEVFCKLFDGDKKLLIDRSPHLFIEHAIRENKIDDIKKKWFKTNAIYTSCQDLISKILQFDNDGDEALCVADDLLIGIAERTIKDNDIVPLYYDMSVAKPQQINSKTVWDSLKSAFKYGNIGEYSNKLTALWNAPNAKENIDTAKVICSLNNFSIDAAKCNVMPKPPIGSEIDRAVKEIDKLKMPYFYQFAKDKDESQVAEYNDNIKESTVNRICKKIESIPQGDFDFSKIGKFKYKTLMNNPKTIINDAVIEKYNDLNKSKDKAFMRSLDKTEVANAIYTGVKKELIESFTDINIKDIVDMIIKYAYTKHKDQKKSFLFNCFGDIMFDNLNVNISKPLGEYIMCSECGERVLKVSRNQKMCSECAQKANKEKTKQRMKLSREIKNIAV